MQTFRITPDHVGQRLDKYLRRQLPGVPISVIYKLIRTKTVRVNGARASNDYLLREGDEVLFRVDTEKILSRGPSDANRGEDAAPPPRTAVPLEVIYEDDHVLAVNKPSGMAVHPGSGIRDGTVVDEVRAYLGPRAVRNDFKASPAHRIDRETSGVLLVAKTRRAMVRFTELFTEGATRKLYLTVVKGRFGKPTGLIEVPLAEHQQTADSKAEHGVKMQSARTRYRVLSQSADAALVACAIDTGRTHQIRRHMAAIGHPVAGDKKHGDFPYNRELRAKWGLKRMFLHALRLGVEHPIHGGNLDVSAPLPDELKSALKRANLQLPDRIEAPPEM